MYEISIDGMESFYLKRIIRMRLEDLRYDCRMLRLREPVDVQDDVHICEALERKNNEIVRLERVQDALIALHKNKNPYL
jgi:hypothetical protein